MRSTIALIKDLKPKHFQNKNADGYTELSYLCANNMHSTIELVTSNYINRYNCWKPKHCNSDIERKYMKKYNFI